MKILVIDIFQNHYLFVSKNEITEKEFRETKHYKDILESKNLKENQLIISCFKRRNLFIDDLIKKHNKEISDISLIKEFRK